MSAKKQTDYSYGNHSGMTTDKIKLTGNTYPHREWLRTELGAEWNKRRKAWLMVAPINNRDCSALAHQLRKAGIEWVAV